LDDEQTIKLGNVTVRALSTPGHAGAHHAYAVTDHTRGDDVWMVLTGDALLVGDAGRPDLHAAADTTPHDMAAELHRSVTGKLLTLSDDVMVYPAHYAGSVCGRGLSPVPASTIGYERRHNRALQFDSEAAFVDALVQDIPPAPPGQDEIVAANRRGRRLNALR
jgi:hydroxyacylglutathione hydrolase